MPREPASDPRLLSAATNATEIAAAQQIETIAAQLRSGKLTIATAARLLAQQLTAQQLTAHELTAHELTAPELTAPESPTAAAGQSPSPASPSPAAQPLAHSLQPWTCQPSPLGLSSQANSPQADPPNPMREPAALGETLVWDIECPNPTAAQLTRELYQSGRFPSQLANVALDNPHAANNSAARTSSRVQIHRPEVFRLAQLSAQLGWPPPAALLQHWQQQLTSIRRQLVDQRWPLLFGPAEDIGITAEGQFVWDLLPARIAQSMLYLRPELFQLETPSGETLLTNWQPPPVENLEGDPAWLAGCQAIQHLLGQTTSTDAVPDTQQHHNNQFSSPFPAEASQSLRPNEQTNKRLNRRPPKRSSRPTRAIAGLVGIGLLIAAVPVSKFLLRTSPPEQPQLATTRQPTSGPFATSNAATELPPISEPLETLNPETLNPELNATDWDSAASNNLESDSLESSGLTTTLPNWQQDWGLLDEELSEFPAIMPTDTAEPEKGAEPQASVAGDSGTMRVTAAGEEKPATEIRPTEIATNRDGQPVNTAELNFETARWETSWPLPPADVGGKKLLTVALLDRPAKIPSPEQAEAGADAGEEAEQGGAPLSFRWLTEISGDDQRASRGLLEIQESDESPVRVRVRVDLRRGRQLELKVITAATLQPELGWRAVTHQGVIELSDSTAAAATEIEQSLSVTRAAYERAEESRQRSQLRARRRMLEDQQDLAKTWLERLATLRRLLARIERELQLQITIAEAPAVTPTTTP